MIDDWFRAVELRITIDEFHRLPRVNGYKHEYFGGRAVLSPRPRNGYAVLDLARFHPLDSANRKLDKSLGQDFALAADIEEYCQSRPQMRNQMETWKVHNAKELENRKEREP